MKKEPTIVHCGICINNNDCTIGNGKHLSSSTQAKMRYYRREITPFTGCVVGKLEKAVIKTTVEIGDRVAVIGSNDGIVYTATAKKDGKVLCVSSSGSRTWMKEETLEVLE